MDLFITLHEAGFENVIKIMMYLLLTLGALNVFFFVGRIWLSYKEYKQEQVYLTKK